MSLQDVSVKNEYRSLIDNVVQEFYIPLLEQAKVYKRAVGFFSSSSLVEITKGIATMASNGGKIQIVASPYLSDEDIEAIVLYQLGALSSFAKAYSLNIEQVRPDGNMYRFASENLDFSVNVAKAVKKYSKWFTLLGASGEILDKTAQELNINVAHEICIEKQYTNSAINYDMANISDSDTVIERIKNLIKTSEINNTDGTKSIVKADTVHFSIDLSVETVKESANIIVPRPVNFNKAVVSGWVE